MNLPDLQLRIERPGLPGAVVRNGAGREAVVSSYTISELFLKFGDGTRKWVSPDGWTLVPETREALPRLACEQTRKH